MAGQGVSFAMPCVSGFVSTGFVSSGVVSTVLLSLLSACSGANDGGDTSIDSGTQDAALTQVDSRSGSGLPATCTGECMQMTLEVQFGAVTRTFDRAFFGLVSPAQSDSGNWEYYIESGSGDDDSCPSKSSPTPRFLLITSGIAPGTTAGEVVAPVAATVIDFEGDLLQGAPLSRSETRSLTWIAADACIPCAEGAEPDRADRMIAVDIDASFAEGTVSGHLYATHCDSLDSL